MGLVVGDEVTVCCQICLAPIDPTGRFNGRVCGRECMRELQWRQALVMTGRCYQIDPESRLGKLAAQEADES